MTSTTGIPPCPAVLIASLTIDGETNEKLIVTPGQFRAYDSSGGLTGTQRLYSNLDFIIFQADFENEDYIAPSIWDVYTYRRGGQIHFEVVVTEDESDLSRVVLLYREVDAYEWQLLDLTYSIDTETATGAVYVPGEIEYIVQAVDSSGNVAYGLDFGNAFAQAETIEFLTFLPITVKDE